MSLLNIKHKYAWTIINIVITLFLVSFVNAQENISPCENLESLTNAQILDCVESELINITDLNYNRISKLLKENPERVSSMLNDSLYFEIFTNNISLLEEDILLLDLENRLASNLSLFNQFADLKKNWFMHYDIIDNNTTITSFDGDRIVIKDMFILHKNFSSNITINNTHLKTNNIVLRKGAIYLYDDLIKLNNSIAYIYSDINETNKTLEANNSKIIMGEMTYQSFESFLLSIKNNTILASGELVIFNKSSESIAYFINTELDNLVEINKEHITINNTFLDLYDGNKAYLRIKSDENLTFAKSCLNKNNTCLEISTDENDSIYKIYSDLKRGVNVAEYTRNWINNYIFENIKISSSSISGQIVDEIDLIIDDYSKPSFNIQTHIQNRLEEIRTSSESHFKSEELVTAKEAFFSNLKNKINSDEHIIEYLNNMKKNILINNYVLDDYDYNVEEIIFLLLVNNSNLQGEELIKFIEENRPLFKKKIDIFLRNGDVVLNDLSNQISELNVIFEKEEPSLIFKVQDKSEILITKDSFDINGNTQNSNIKISSNINLNNEEHSLIFFNNQIEVCSDCQIHGSYLNRAQFARNRLNQKHPRSTSFRNSLSKKWNVDIQPYVEAYDEPREDNFLKAVIRGAHIASQNVHGVQVTPEEVLINSLHEGAILLFWYGHHCVPIKFYVTKDDKIISFDGQVYNLIWEWTHGGYRPYIRSELEKTYMFDVDSSSDFEVVYDFDQERFREYPVYREELFNFDFRDARFENRMQIVTIRKTSVEDRKFIQLDYEYYFENRKYYNSVRLNNLYGRFLRLFVDKTRNNLEESLILPFFDISSAELGPVVEYSVVPKRQEVHYYIRIDNRNVYRLYVKDLTGGDIKKKLIRDGVEYDVLVDETGLEYVKVDHNRLLDCLNVPNKNSVMIQGREVRIDNRADDPIIWRSRDENFKGTYYLLEEGASPIIDSEKYLGLDFIGDRMPTLIENKFVSPNINFRAFPSQSDNRETTPAEFFSIQDAMEASAGEFAYTKWILKNDLNNFYNRGLISRDPSTLTDLEIFYWTAVYFNVGVGLENRSAMTQYDGVSAGTLNGGKLLLVRNDLKMLPGFDHNVRYSSNWIENAAKRAAAYEYITSLNLFP